MRNIQGIPQRMRGTEGEERFSHPFTKMDNVAGKYIYLDVKGTYDYSIIVENLDNKKESYTFKKRLEIINE
jgi:hypothetical protein